MNVDEPIFSIEEAEKIGFDSVNQIEEVMDLGFEFKWKYNFYQGTYNKKVIVGKKDNITIVISPPSRKTNEYKDYWAIFKTNKNETLYVGALGGYYKKVKNLLNNKEGDENEQE